MANNDMNNEADTNMNAQNMRDTMNRGMSAVRDRIGTARSSVSDFVRERPYASVGVALGAGWLFAKLLSSRD